MSKVHFVGINGIGMSALAKYYTSQGWQVTGSDLSIAGHDAANVSDDANKIIYSSAVKDGNPELVRARSLEIPLLSYAQALGELTKQYITIAVSGSHGKSTTTALLSLMMIKAGLDPTVIIGTRLKEFGGENFRPGKSRYLVIEADEWANSFHYYYPAVAVITNVDKEHLDTFGNLRGVIKSFNYYLSNNVGEKGKIIINAADNNSLKAVKNAKATVIPYSMQNPDSRLRGNDRESWPLKIPGSFNQLNAEAAWQAAKLLGVKKKDALAAVKNYRGSWRRLEELELLPQLTGLPAYQLTARFYSDYAHHPTEIKAVGLGLKEKYPKKKLALIFQPHQVERLTNLFNDFAGSFKDFDEIGILPAYEVAGRELIGGRTSKDLAKKIKARYLPKFEESFNIIPANSVVVFMGAGDIDNEVRKYFRSKLDFN